MGSNIAQSIMPQNCFFTHSELLLIGSIAPTTPDITLHATRVVQLTALHHGSRLQYSRAVL
jgi:hypothetical protein